MFVLYEKKPPNWWSLTQPLALCWRLSAVYIFNLIRALDEWEVFLDNVNRKEIALKLLNFGLNPINKDFQFIFIRFCKMFNAPSPNIWRPFVSVLKVLEMFKKNWKMKTETKSVLLRSTKKCKNPPVRFFWSLRRPKLSIVTPVQTYQGSLNKANFSYNSGFPLPLVHSLL